MFVRAAAAFFSPDFRAAARCAGESRQGHCTRASSGTGTVRRAVSATRAAEALIFTGSKAAEGLIYSGSKAIAQAICDIEAMKRSFLFVCFSPE